MTLRMRVYRLVDVNQTDSFWSKAFDTAIIALILANVMAIILESYAGLRMQYKAYFLAFEYFSTAVFTLEYLMRLWVAPLHYRQLKPWAAYFRYGISMGALIDLAAILPTYLPFITPVDTRFMRVLRLFRLARIFKLRRYSESFGLIGQVMREKRTELYATLFVTFMLMVVAATLMYFVEGQAQPEAFPNIVATFWWAVATLTTVGYGDVYPITDLGKFISGVIALLGIGLVALPTGILSSAFVDKLNEKKQPQSGTHCPTCGRPWELHDEDAPIE